MLKKKNVVLYLPLSFFVCANLIFVFFSSKQFCIAFLDAYKECFGFCLILLWQLPGLRNFQVVMYVLRSVKQINWKKQTKSANTSSSFKKKKKKKKSEKC